MSKSNDAKLSQNRDVCDGSALRPQPTGPRSTRRAAHDGERKRKCDRWTNRRREEFLAVLSASCNVRAACAAVDMSPRGAYLLRRRDKAFADAWREAMAMGYDALEGALLRHAIVALGGDDDADGDRPASAAGARGGIAVAERPAVDPGTARRGSGMNAKALPVNDVQLALVLLSRHRRDVDEKPIRGRRATSEETDAALSRKLDALARKLKTPL